MTNTETLGHTDRMYITGLMVLVLAMGQGSSGHMGTHFIYKNNVHTSYNTWLITFTFDLAPYRKYLNTLRQEVFEYQTAFAQLAEIDSKWANTNGSVHSNQTKQIRNNVLRLMEKESLRFELEANRLQTKFDEIMRLVVKNHKHSKRSLFPFLGQIVSKLIGVATTRDLKTIKQAIVTLSSSQDKIKHVVQDSLSILNKTHKFVQENRNAINSLQGSIDFLNSRLDRLQKEVFTVIEPEITYMQLTSRLHDIFHGVYAAMQSVELSVLELYDQIFFSINGLISPSLVSPPVLQETLKEIKKQLPSDVNLPYFLSGKGLREYYQNLYGIIIPDKDSFHVVVAVPLLQNKASFYVYETISVPVPDDTLSLSAQYELESKVLAINQAADEYVFLSDTEAIACTNSPYCTVQSPSYSLSKAPTCVTSLFTKKSNLINKHCRKIVNKAPEIPVIRHLYDGSWLISTIENFELNISCQYKQENFPRSNQHLIEKGVQISKLDPYCSARSKWFILPAHVKGESSFDVKSQFTDHLGQIRSLPNIWEDVSNNDNLLTGKEVKGEILPNIDSLSLDNLEFVLDSIPENIPLTSNPAAYTTYVITAIVIICIIAGIGLGLYIYYKYNCFSKVYRTNWLYKQVSKILPHEPPTDPNVPIEVETPLNGDTIKDPSFLK